MAVTNSVTTLFDAKSTLTYTMMLNIQEDETNTNLCAKPVQKQHKTAVPEFLT